MFQCLGYGIVQISAVISAQTIGIVLIFDEAFNLDWSHW